MMFIFVVDQIHVKVRYNPEMAHHSLQCLAQLATLNGQIFVDDKAKTEYLGHYLLTFLSIFMRQDYIYHHVLLKCLIVWLRAFHNVIFIPFLARLLKTTKLLDWPIL